MKQEYIINHGEKFINAFLNDDVDSLEELIFGIPNSEQIQFKDEYMDVFLQNMPYIIDVAAFYGAYNCVLSIFINCSKIYHIDSRGRTIMHYAAYSGNMRLIFFLIHNAFHLNPPDKLKITPLHIAISRSHLSLVQFIIIHAVKMDLHEAQKLLHYSSSCGSTFEILKFLMSYGCKLEEPDPINGKTFFKKALETDNLEFFSYLLNQKVSYSPDENINTLIHMAAKRDASKIIQFLIQNGVDIDYKDIQGKTPLHYAAIHHSFNSLLTLVEAGSQIDPTDKHGRTPLHYAAMKGFIGIVETLFYNGADPELIDKHYNSSIDYAIQRNQTMCLNFFISIGYF